MAERRMFSCKIIESDAFLDMPLSAQALYIHLNMEADDDGFVSNPRRVCRSVNATPDDLNLLIAKRFILYIEGVAIIKHWKINNAIRADRYHPTVYSDIFAQLHIKENLSYTEAYKYPDMSGCGMGAERGQNGCGMGAERVSEDRIGKDRIGEDRIGEEPAPQKSGDVFLDFAGDDVLLLSSLRAFETMRAAIKRPMNDVDRQLLIDKLKNDIPTADWVEAIKKSVFNHYSDVYPISHGRNCNRSQSQPDPEAQKEYEERVMNFINGKGL